MQITFGRDGNQVYHTTRWIAAAGLDIVLVSDAIRSDLLRTLPVLADRGLIKGKVRFSGQLIRYNAYRFADGSVNVGRIIVERE